jgi:diguanylate cyclase (GGDEF)-like protein
MSETLQSCQSAAEAYKVITLALQQFFPLASGALCIVNAPRDLVEAQSTWGDPPGEAVFRPDDCMALRRGQVQLISDPSKALVCRHIDNSQPRISLCAPLMAQGETLGVLILLFPFRAEPAETTGLSEAERRIPIAAAEQMALSLANLRLRETLRDQSIRDPLTGLFNRRYMEETLERELRRAGRSNRPVAVVMLDLDHFKRFNDNFGHDAGDMMLREVAAFLKANVRAEDVVCRFGGEEFAIILPDATIEIAFNRAERLRKGLHKLQVKFQNQPLGAITFSAGVAVFPGHGNTSELLLRAADQALYQAKHDGRDRVVYAQEPNSGD